MKNIGGRVPCSFGDQIPKWHDDSGFRSNLVPVRYDHLCPTPNVRAKEDTQTQHYSVDLTILEK